jgi:hypothetical protein
MEGVETMEQQRNRRGRIAQLPVTGWIVDVGPVRIGIESRAVELGKKRCCQNGQNIGQFALSWCGSPTGGSSLEESLLEHCERTKGL